jgi:hypothetical protein
MPPKDPIGTALAVNCYTCRVNIWQGDVAPADGQVLLTAYSDSTPGTACPSKVDPYPHKTTAIAAAQVLKSATRADLAAMVARIEAKVGKLP